MRRGRSRAPSGRSGYGYSFLRPPGSGSGDLLGRVLGRAGADVLVSFRRRDRGLVVVLLSASASLLTRTVECHSK